MFKPSTEENAMNSFKGTTSLDFNMSGVHKLKKELERNQRTLETIIACQEVLVLSQTKSDLLQKICDVCVSVGGFRMAWIGVADSKNFIKPLAASGVIDGYLDSRDLRNGQMNGDGHPGSIAYKTSKPYLIQDIVKMPVPASWQTEALKRGYSSVLALPLVSESKIFGCFCLYSAEVDDFSDKEVIHLHKLADNIVYGIVSLQTRLERYRVENELKKSLNKLRITLGAISEALERTVELRDPYTAGHQKRVSDLSGAIAAQMGLPEDGIDGIRVGGILHDIGKIYVPAEILMKPGKLSALEFNLIKLHPQVGFDVLKHIDFPWPIADIVLQHHERMDGSGYPEGLKADDILIEARILAVADVVEAMASHRPYRAALGVDKAIEEIQSQQGVLYETEVVKACTALFGEHNYTFPS